MKINFTLFLIALIGWGSICAQPFVPGNVVVFRAGDGLAPLRSVSTKVFLDEYTSVGVLVRSIQMPNTASGANAALTCSGSATSEGYLNRSANSQYLLLGGYSVDTGIVSISSSSAILYKRVVARVDFNGNINTTTVLDSAFSGGNIRSVVSQDGTGLWMSGSNTGLRYTTLGVSADKRITTTSFSYPANYRALHLFNSQLYASTSSGTAYRLATVGTGTPIDTGNTIAQLPGILPVGLPNQFFIADVNGSMVLYVTDESASTSGGGIQKYTLVGGSWVSNGTISVATSARGLIGVVTGTVVNLYTCNSTELYQLIDASGPGNTISGTATLLATAPANTAFRGLAMAPEAVAPLKLTSFDAILNQGSVNLKWTTNNETNVKGFNVEKSIDGKTFRTIGNVEATNTPEANYSIADLTPNKGINYYRLKMIDKDGKINLSEVVSVNTSKSTKISIYPNPVVNNIIVSHAKSVLGAFIRILTNEGQLIKSVSIKQGALQTSVVVSELSKGGYVLIFENQGIKEVAKFIKQ